MSRKTPVTELGWEDEGKRRWGIGFGWLTSPFGWLKRWRAEDEDEWEEDRVHYDDEDDEEEEERAPRGWRRPRVLPALEVVRMGRRTVGLCWKSRGVGWGMTLAGIMVAKALVPAVLPVLAAFLLQQHPDLVKIGKTGKQGTTYY